MMHTATTTRDRQAHSPDPAQSAHRRWTGARIAGVVLGVGLLAGAAAALGGAAAVRGFEDDRRDGEYLTSDLRKLNTSGYALAVEKVDVDGLPADALGNARLRVTGVGDAPLFAGVARSSDVEAYLAGVGYSSVDELDDPGPRYTHHAGTAPDVAPADSDIWVAQVQGAGSQTLRWTPREGSWTVIVMNSDATKGVDVSADVGATAPIVGFLARLLVVSGVVLLAAGAGLILLMLRRARRR